MKVMILNGSPDKKGITQSLIEYLFDDVDFEVVEYWSYFSKFKACIDCQYCFKNPNRCVIEDDFQKMIKDIEKADLIVLASPLHFNTFSGTFLSAISRMQYLFALKYVHQINIDFGVKKGLTLITAGNNYKDMFEAIKQTDKLIYQHLGISDFQRLLINESDNNVLEDLLKKNKDKIESIKHFINT